MQDPVGAAGVTANIGTLHELRGAPAEAVAIYRTAYRELDGRSERQSAAIVAANLGRLLTTVGSARDGIPWTLRSLSFRLRWGLPQVINDVYWLRQQQEQCPQDALDKILGTWRDQEFASHARRLLR